MLGHHRHASETPFKRCFARWPVMARLLWYLDPLSLHQLKKKETLSKLDWTRSEMFVQEDKV